ncbi:MAG TPA: Hsp20 family protein [Acetobacteraceae bacterium]|jgi:molecular chaperone IbpA|nr:Hsp20 family protein [Acetobacteraceae bacterium]
MTALDFSPLFRTAIGFDRLARQLETARTAPDAQSYPPYNIEKTGEDSYVLTMAVAGFGPNDIEVVARENVLTVSGRAPQAEEGRAFLYRGIAGRAFERRFVLADHIVVEGANLENGLLQLNLKRVVPEALKPRRIAVQSGSPAIANEQGEQTQAA